MSELITNTTFAKRVGVSETAIRKAIKANRISVTISKGRKRIDWDTELATFVRTSTSKKVIARFKNVDLSPPVIKPLEVSLPDSGGDNYSKAVMDKKIENMNGVDAAELTNVIKAKRQQMEYEKEMSLLIEFEVVDVEVKDILEKVKSSMLSIPDRVSMILEGLSYEKIYKTLTAEIVHSLGNLSLKILKRD